MVWSSACAVAGKNSPLRPFVEEVQGYSREWWETQHRQGKLHHYTKEELAENKALEEERQRLRQEKRDQVQKERQAVLDRAEMLAQLDAAKQREVEQFLEGERRREDVRRHRWVD